MWFARHLLLEAVQNFFAEFQQQRFDFFWTPIFLSPLGLCNISVQNRLNQQGIHAVTAPLSGYFSLEDARQYSGYTYILTNACVRADSRITPAWKGIPIKI
jgi:hypothetical protein